MLAALTRPLNAQRVPDAGLDRAPGTRVVVVDSHRPLHLHNTAAGNEAVLVLRDSRERAPGTRAESFPEPPSESEADGDSDAEDCSLHENGGTSTQSAAWMEPPALSPAPRFAHRRPQRAPAHGGRRRRGDLQDGGGVFAF